MAVRLEENRTAGLAEEILRLKREKNAVILAHNYQRPEVQDIADVLGDSLALARAAVRTDADVIVFCGVHFMAETAAVLNPDKTVLLPDLEAGCSLADSITADALRAWKAEHPGAVVVAYVNTSAEVKAESDYCCTSSNAVQVVQSIPEDREILFLPDMFLGSYVKRVTGRENMHIWMGECHVHAGIRPHDIEATLGAHPDAELLIHPECGCSTSNMYLLAEGRLPADRTHVLSTSGMLQRARESEKRAFIVATEVGILYQMERQNPGKTFIPANRAAVCPFMKMITLEKVRDALADLKTVVSVPSDVAERARIAIERMVAIG
ncbi:quinolinate synthase NadA [Alicyclobacillus sp.]|uniref:quinolinate synthase NadA n=1 Tax=Alicyclobacillus sp. TaxID=61169 RepID=UPI0025BBC3C3|nr:quinolinate synthase NadA [Alicyclobacillus sp.]MCL6517003.1 quinolinate synthase NadA [Alicyclobacillus sp.]